ncbi:hypothetical protein [Acetoanaerobium sticklandii]|uniref:hypothetical protein n=1 Tax=Acetoanaerobium sticklandii TaxID=1511 RepID=UPI003A8F4510
MNIINHMDNKNLLKNFFTLSLLILLILNLYLIMSFGISSPSDKINSDSIKTLEITGPYKNNIRYSDNDNIIKLIIDRNTLNSIQYKLIIQYIYYDIKKMDKNLHNNIINDKIKIIKALENPNAAKIVDSPKYLKIDRDLKANTLEITLYKQFYKRYNNFNYVHQLIFLFISLFISAYYIVSLTYLKNIIIFIFYDFYYTTSFKIFLIPLLGICFYFIDYYIRYMFSPISLSDFGKNFYLNIYLIFLITKIINFILIITYVLFLLPLIYSIIYQNKSYFYNNNKKLQTFYKKLKLYYALINLVYINKYPEFQKMYKNYLKSKNIKGKIKSHSSDKFSILNLNKFINIISSSKYITLKSNLVYDKKNESILFKQDYLIPVSDLKKIVRILNSFRNKISTISISLVISIIISTLFIFKEFTSEIIDSLKFDYFYNSFSLGTNLTPIIGLISILLLLNIMVEMLSYDSEIGLLEEILENINEI